MKKACIFLAILIILMNSVVVAATSLSDIKAQQEKIKKELQEVKKEKTQVQSDVQKLENEIASTESEIDKLDLEMGSLDESIKKSEQEIKEAEEKYLQQQELLEARIIALYKSGKTSYLEVLLTSTDMSDFLSKYYLVGKIAENDKNLLSEIEEQKHSIETKKEELTKQLSAREEAKKNKENKIENLNDNREQKDELVKQLTEEEKSLKKKQDELDSEYNKIKEESAKASSSSSSSKYTGGTMTWPVPSSSRVTCYYGMRYHPITGVYKLHTGIDIGASMGSAIVATNSGKVIQTGSSPAWGNYVSVDHGGGVVSFYAHASAILVSKGQSVSKGETIAKIGTTGYSTGPHLHFEIRENGTSINPLNSSKGYLK